MALADWIGVAADIQTVLGMMLKVVADTSKSSEAPEPGVQQVTISGVMFYRDGTKIYADSNFGIDQRLSFSAADVSSSGGTTVSTTDVAIPKGLKGLEVTQYFSQYDNGVVSVAYDNKEAVTTFISSLVDATRIISYAIGSFATLATTAIAINNLFSWSFSIDQQWGDTLEIKGSVSNNPFSVSIEIKDAHGMRVSANIASRPSGPEVGSDLQPFQIATFSFPNGIEVTPNIESMNLQIFVTENTYSHLVEKNS